MSNEPEEIKTEHLTVKLTRKPDCIFHLDIDVSPTGAKAAHVKAIKTVNKEISIPGFRKGKAPQDLVTKQFSKYVTPEWHNILVHTAFNEFLNKTHLYPFTTDQKSIRVAEVKKADLNNGAHLVIEYEGKPHIPAINAASMRLKTVPKKTLTPAEVDEVINQIQLYHAEWTPIQDRPVQEGDFVDLTIDTLEDPPHNICTQMQFQVVDGKMGQWMRHLLIGKNTNDAVEGISEWDQPGPTPEGFRPTPCIITIDAIKSAVYPPLDDELAKKVGLQTIGELRPRVEADLHQKAEEETQDLLRAQIEEQLIASYPFDIPASLIDNQKKEMAGKRIRQANLAGLSPEKLDQKVKEIHQATQDELIRSYRLFFLTRAIAAEHHLEVHDQDILREMMTQIRLPEERRSINLSLPEDEIRSQLFVNLLSRKVLDFLVSHAAIE